MTYRLEDKLEEGTISPLKKIGGYIWRSLPVTIPAVLGITAGIVSYDIYTDRTVLNPCISGTEDLLLNRPLAQAIYAGIIVNALSLVATTSITLIGWGLYENFKIYRIMSKYYYKDFKDLDKNVKRRRKYEEDEINTQS
ncbi:MAG: hypothetical protein AABX29_06390 [Nanoarchaeota archaeon]